MDSSQSDSDDLFFYSGRKNIQKQFEKRLSEVSTPSSQEIKSIFNSDDDEVFEVTSTQTRSSTKRKKTKANDSEEEYTPVSKEGRFNADKLLAAFDKNINRELTMQAKEVHKTDVLSDTINSIRKDLAQQEARLNQPVSMPVVENVDDIESADENKENEKETESIDNTIQTVGEESKEIEILEGEEKESVLEDSYEGMEGKIVLKMRSESDEENVVVIRMPTNCPFQKLINSLKRCGFDGGKVMFDCSPLNPASTPSEMDMEDGDLLDVEM